MATSTVTEAAELLEKANASLEPDLVPMESARRERDHVELRNAGGPTATTNFKWRCWPCHEAKTARDRKAGKLTPRPPDEERGPR